jgi:hypothetical protein
MSIAIGTTPRTRMVEDFRSVVMLAMFQASTKLCHWGLVGMEIPRGVDPCG